MAFVAGAPSCGVEVWKVEAAEPGAAADRRPILAFRVILSFLGRRLLSWVVRPTKMIFAEMSSALSLHDVVVSASYLTELRRRIACGADVNERDNRGCQPIHTAIRLNLTRTVRCLVGAGADLNGRDDFDLTPLMIACHNGRVKGSALALLLLEAGASVNEVRAADGITALHWAAENAQARVVEALLAAGAPVEGPPGAEMTPLMFAAMGGNVPALEVLVHHGADIYRRRTGRPLAMQGLTAKGHAIEFKRRKALMYLEWLEH